MSEETKHITKDNNKPLSFKLSDKFDEVLKSKLQQIENTNLTKDTQSVII